MGNHPHRVYRDEKTVRVGDRNYSKRDLQIIQQRLRDKDGIKTSKSSNSLTRSQQMSSMQSLDESFNHLGVGQKSRNVTPSGSHVKNLTLGSYDLTNVQRNFDLTNQSSSKNTGFGGGRKFTSNDKELINRMLPPSSSQSNTGNRLQTVAVTKNQQKKLELSTSLQHDARDYFAFSPQSQDIFDHILESRDEIGELDHNMLLEQYYRKGSRPDPIRKSSEKSSDAESHESPKISLSEKSGEKVPQSKLNKFAIRMQRHMQINNPQQNVNDGDSSSSHSTYNGLSYKKDAPVQESFDFDNLNFSHIPAMSSDGMHAAYDKHTTVTTEPEEEEGVLDYGNDYKLSIMKRKRPLPPQAQSESQQKEKEVNNDHDDSDNPNRKVSWPIFNQRSSGEEEKAHISTGSYHDDEAAEIKGKSDNTIRSKLMQKLSLNRMIDPAGIDKPKSHQTLIIWDWDDTLMASTMLSPYQSQILKPSIRKKLSKQVQQQLDQLEDLVIKLLRKSVRQGKTYIITNAGQGWVELSSARFLPKLYKELLMNSQKNGIHVISARSLFEKQMPNAFKEWKFKTFSALSQQMDKDILTNIVAVGDSMIEIDAANSLSQQFSMSCIKTVKLKEQPNILELIRQVELIHNQLEEICNCAKNLTIRLQKVQEEENKAE